MVAEIRRIGHRWALYTDDIVLYRRLTKFGFTARPVRYLQRGKVVGIDVYFNTRLKCTVQRIKHGQLPLDM
jgi:hypothetical protein